MRQLEQNLDGYAPSGKGGGGGARGQSSSDYYDSGPDRGQRGGPAMVTIVGYEPSGGGGGGGYGMSSSSSAPYALSLKHI